MKQPNSVADKFLGELRLGKRITTTPQSIAGSLAILLGLVFLLTSGTVARAGLWSPLASLYISIIFSLTLLSVVELLAGTGEHGGTFFLVHETAGGWFGFLTGWSILTASLGLLAVFSLAAAGQVTRLFSIDPVYQTMIGLGILTTLVILQLIRVNPRRIFLPYLTLPLLALLGLGLLSALPKIQIEVFAEAPGFQLGTLNSAAAWLASGYMVFESLLMSRHQIRSPNRLTVRTIVALSIAGTILFTVALFVHAGLAATLGGPDLPLVSLLATGSLFPAWFVALLALLILVLAANSCLLTAVRQAYSLSLEGAFPTVLRRIFEPTSMPLLLFGLVFIGTDVLLLWVTPTLLINLASIFFIVVMVLLNVGAIYSWRYEPERRRTFTVPFPPLVPGLAIALNLALLWAFPMRSILISAGWLGVGGLFFLFYGRLHVVEAHAGEVVFGHVKEPGDRERAFRILVPIGQSEERHMVLHLAVALANQIGGEVVPLQVIRVADPLAVEEGRRMAEERNLYFRWSTRKAQDLNVPIYPITRLSRSISEGIIDTASEENCNLVLLSWLIEEDERGEQIGSTLRRVVREAPCNVAVFAYHQDFAQSGQPGQLDQSGAELSNGNHEFKFRPRKILIPTSGGPNAPLAIRLALLLASDLDATVSTVYIAGTNATADDVAEGRLRIQQTIDTMREQAADLINADNGFSSRMDDIPISGDVVKAPNVIEGLVEEGAGYDLLMLGASEESILDQVLFGNLPEQVAVRSSSPVLIVKRYRGLPRLWLQRSWDALFGSLPRLSQEEQIEVYRSIHHGARPDVDFFIMISLSALIASFGLLQDSSAVIIGAMLVAPLFSPLLATSLAIIQGNVRLLRLAIESTTKGLILAIGLSFLLSYLTPYKALTDQITIRTVPNLYDLAIAFASGIAGAYAIARRDVAAALPGVAIAAALVPPLGVIGIGLALGDFYVVSRSGLLFFTNLVAITLAGSITFFLLGFRPGARAAREMHLRRAFMITVVLFIIVAVPLGIFFFQSFEQSRTNQIIQETVTEYIADHPTLELVSGDDIKYAEQENQFIITVPVYSHSTVTETIAQGLSVELTNALRKPVLVRIALIPLVEQVPFVSPDE